MKRDFTVTFVEKIFPYSPEEYFRWCQADIDGTVAPLVHRSGNLGRSYNTYINQAKDMQNYPEVRYAIHLVEEQGFSRGGILYENYSLSYEVHQRVINQTGLRANGALIVRNVLSNKFFQEFDRLFYLNHKKFKNSKGNLQTIQGALVDLCAIDTEKRRIGLYEIKKYSPGSVKTESVFQHQLFVLAASRYIINIFGDLAFVNEIPYALEADIVAFICDNDISIITPKKYEFNLLI